MGSVVEFVFDLLGRALGILISVTDMLTAIGFLVTFLALAVAGLLWLAGAVLGGLRSRRR